MIFCFFFLFTKSIKANLRLCELLTVFNLTGQLYLEIDISFLIGFDTHKMSDSELCHRNFRKKLKCHSSSKS